jgi:hypothetical protein
MFTQEELELQYELGAEIGDPRVCPFHPHVKTSSADGLHDAPCDECEGEMGDWSAYMDWIDSLAVSGPICTHKFIPWHPKKHCHGFSWEVGKLCRSSEEHAKDLEEIPF